RLKAVPLGDPFRKEPPVPRVTLHAPDITCDHCIATIRRTADAVDGASFVSGDPDARAFVVDLATGGALDALASALSDAGYPLADASDAATAGADADADADELASPSDATHTAGGDPRAVGWQPAYRVTRTQAGADVNYDCYCGCDAGFALDRAQADPAAESCCCGNHMLVGRDAGERLRARLDNVTSYRVEVAPVAMPWGQPLEVALAIPDADGGDMQRG
ncbi:MAG: heavy-metal-associated domain-containing protein, partial [Chloroflexi bacterium]|nr:heavy-metal-associated domain-containing protein [Chloroflexota bacterium]